MENSLPQSVNPVELGARLQQARKAAGITQQAAADHLEMARTTITAIEKGTRRIQPSELARLAGLYGREVGELLRPGKPVEPLIVQLRSTLAPGRAALPGLEEHAGELQRLAEDYIALERICGASLPRRYPAPYEIGGVTPELAAEDVATAERNRLGLGDGPILNLRELLESEVGLRIFYLKLPSRIAAMYAYNDALGGCISVNSDHPPERRRMSLAHDYGHFLTNRYQPEVSVLGGYERRPHHERFAEAFARAFLMPAAALSRRYHELHRARKGGITPADLCTLADFYRVSWQALTRRMEELELIPSGTYDRLQQAGFRVGEARVLLDLPERPSSSELLPTRYRLLAVEAYERGDLSEGQLARFLRVDRVEARRIVTELSSRVTVSEEGDIGTTTLDFGRPLSGAEA
jgi:Zn-dependent peptidase ImmA (M78 family)/transcriptional regulator with XRE-family HTH domain